MVKYYIQLKHEIMVLEKELSSISEIYIQSHSLISCTLSNNVLEVSQRAPNVFQAVSDILATEKATYKRLMRIIKRYSLFCEEFTQDELFILEHHLFRDMTLLKRACKHVEELDYYLAHHNEKDQEDKLMENDLIIATLEVENELKELFGGGYFED